MGKAKELAIDIMFIALIAIWILCTFAFVGARWVGEAGTIPGIVSVIGFSVFVAIGLLVNKGKEI